MKLDLTQTYKRIDNILYCNDIAIVKFTHSKFPDFNPLGEQGVKYIQSYIDMWKDHNYFEVLPGWMVADDTQEELDLMNLEVPQHLQQIIDGVKQGAEAIHKALMIPITDFEIKSSTTFGVESHDPNSSRLDQVRYWFSRGVTSPSIIASTIDANPSYVQRLLKQVKDEEAKS